MTHNPYEVDRRRAAAGFLLSLLVLGIVFVALAQLDVPVARFLRSIHSTDLERIGDAGTRLGSGLVLVLISLALVLSGLLLRHAHLRHVGTRSLLAHGVAALVTQALKHVVGRPRPRLLHANDVSGWHPSFESGLDSFPSGHTTASFAVAAVVARHFPPLAWVVYCAATYVAVSRVVRGSHYPTDIFAGACIGLVVGAAFAEPLATWKRSVRVMVIRMQAPVVVLFALMWLATHTSVGPLAQGLSALGTVLVVAGLGLRLQARLRMQPVLLHYGRLLIIPGLGMVTGSLVILALVLLSLAIFVLTALEGDDQINQPVQTRGTAATGSWTLAEVGLTIGLLLVVFALQALSGLLPLLIP